MLWLAFVHVLQGARLTQDSLHLTLTVAHFESVVQVISLRAQPMLMNTPIVVDGVSAGIDDYGSPTLTGAGWVFKFAFERQGAHTLDTLRDELDGIVLNGGTIDTKNSVNTEFSKQDVL